jgi:hypothetical protein
MKFENLQPRRHPAPEGWPREVFEAVTDAFAQAVLATVRRRLDEEKKVVRHARQHPDPAHHHKEEESDGREQE